MGKNVARLEGNAELAALILNTETGKWINLSAFEDKESAANPELNDSLSF